MKALPFLLTTLFYLLATRNGNNTTFDSQWYQAIAENLAKSFTYAGSGEEFPIYWPPLYSFILSLAHPYSEEFVLVFHWLCLLGILFVWQKIAKTYLSSTWDAIFTFFLALSAPLLMLAVFVWTEIFFVLLLSLYLLFLKKFIECRNHQLLLLAAVFGFLMMLQRNAGFFLFIGSLFGLLLSLKRFSRKDVLYVSVHGLLAVSGFVVWNVYVIVVRNNHHVPGELLPAVSPERNFVLTFTELGQNIIPAVLPPFLIVVFGLVLLLSIGIRVYEDRFQYPALALIFVTVVFYLLVWVVIPAGESDIGRFLAVILPPFYLLIFVFIKELYGRYQKIQIPLSICLLIWGVYGLLRVIKNVMLWGNLV